jgi:2-iminobutanoate/2-iminopropanoate deaminase
MSDKMIRYFHPSCMPESSAPFSQVVIDERYAHLAGIVAADFPAGQAVLGDVQRETAEVMALIGQILQELNLGFGQIVRTDVHLATLEDFDVMDRAYRKFFENGFYPARTTTESPHLFGGSKVEITCMARTE